MGAENISKLSFWDDTLQPHEACYKHEMECLEMRCFNRWNDTLAPGIQRQAGSIRAFGASQAHPVKWKMKTRKVKNEKKLIVVQLKYGRQRSIMVRLKYRRQRTDHSSTWTQISHNLNSTAVVPNLFFFKISINLNLSTLNDSKRPPFKTIGRCYSRIPNCQHWLTS